MTQDHPPSPEFSKPESFEDAAQEVSEETIAPSESSPPDVTGATPPVAPDDQAATPLIPTSETPAAAEQPIAQTVQDYWKQIQPVLTAQTVKVLRVIIQGLESVVDKLEQEQEIPAKNHPPRGESASGVQKPSISVEELRQKIQPLWERFQGWWAILLRQVRTRLPESLDRQLSDRVLSGAIASILIILLWTVSGVFSGKPKPDQVAVSPSPKTTIPVVKPKPTPNVKAPPPATPTPQKPRENKPIVQKPVMTNPSPVAKPSSPPPPLKLTPEQTLIARIQDQVAEISNQYVNGLIQSVQANFRSSRLIVKVSDGWYGLSQTQQNKLANEMLQRAQKLNFSKLEVTDSTGTLLARSPVVGPEMIILKRQLGSQETA